VNAPFLLTLRSLPPLSCNTTAPDSPDTVPPIEYVFCGATAAVANTARPPTRADSPVWLVKVRGLLTPVLPARSDCSARAV
jgi:hypothetical protein